MLLSLSLASLSDPRSGFHPPSRGLYEGFLECDGHHGCQLCPHLLLPHRGVSSPTHQHSQSCKINNALCAYLLEKVPVEKFVLSLPFSWVIIFKCHIFYLIWDWFIYGFTSTKEKLSHLVILCKHLLGGQGNVLVPLQPFGPSLLAPVWRGRRSC